MGWRPTSHARVAAAVLHVGSREDRDFTGFPAEAVVLKPYTRVDLSGELDVPPRHAESPVALTVRVDNALNASYEEIRNFAVPGRTLYLGVRLHVRR